MDGCSIASLEGEAVVTFVVVDIVVVYGQDVAVVVGVKAVCRVVAHLVSPPDSMQVAVRVHPKVVVLNVRVLDVTVDGTIVEQSRVARAREEHLHLTIRVVSSVIQAIWRGTEKEEISSSMEDLRRGLG